VTETANRMDAGCVAARRTPTQRCPPLNANPKPRTVAIRRSARLGLPSAQLAPASDCACTASCCSSARVRSRPRTGYPRGSRTWQTCCIGPQQLELLVRELDPAPSTVTSGGQVHADSGRQRLRGPGGAAGRGEAMKFGQRHRLGHRSRRHPRPGRPRSPPRQRGRVSISNGSARPAGAAAGRLSQSTRATPDTSTSRSARRPLAAPARSGPSSDIALA